MSCFTSLDTGRVVLAIDKAPDTVWWQRGHERDRPVAKGRDGLRLAPLTLDRPSVSGLRLRLGARRGFQSPAFSARTPRRKTSLISPAMVSASGSTRGLYHVYNQFIIPKSPKTAVRVEIPPVTPA